MRLSLPVALVLCSAAVPAPALGEPARLAQEPAVAFRDALRNQASGPVTRFYAERGYRPFWIGPGGLTPPAERFLALLRTSEADGLSGNTLSAEEIADIASAATGLSPQKLAAAVLRIAGEFVRFVQLSSRARLPLRHVQPQLERASAREDEILSRVASADSPAEYVAQMKWMSPHYTGLRSAILRYRERWEGLPQTRVPPGSSLRLGAMGERVRLLRQRLGLSPGDLFDREADDQLRAFQADHGIEPTGILDARTVAALNDKPGRYLRILQLNLERARALPGLETRHILVNAATAQLSYYEDGQLKGSMRVVVGTPRSPTPLVAGLLHYATVNPYWNVPVDLVSRNIAPAVARGAPLKSTYEVLSDWSDNAEVVDPSAVDWRAVAAGRQQIRLRQKPGPANPMGQVKFTFANELGIYLHDTPERELFDKPARYFSNGCIRLEDADRLLTWLLKGRSTIPEGRPEQHLLLPDPLPVYVTYLTAVPDERTIAFSEDTYRRDGVELAEIAQY